MLWTRRRLLVSLFVGVVAIGASALVLRAPLYESSMKILVTREEDLLTESEILNSRAVLAAVAQQLSWSEEQAQQSAARLTTTPVVAARVMKVTYCDRTPQQAAQFLTTLFEQYSAQRQSLRQATSADTALRARSAAFNQKLDATTNALKQLDAQHGFTAPEAQQELLLKQWFDAQKQAEAAQTERRELEQRSLALRTQLAAQPEQIETSSSTKYAAALDKMKEELHALEMQRTELQQKYQPNHRLLREHEQRIAQAQALIAREEQNPPRERAFARNETRQRLSDELLRAEADLAALAQREQRLKTLARDYQTQLAALDGQSFKKSDLERERALNEDAWRRFEQKAQEAEINAVLQQANEAQVRLAEAPVVNPRPLNATGARALIGLVFLGLVLAAGGTLVIESWHPRLRHEVGLHRRLGLPVLASLPARRDEH